MDLKSFATVIGRHRAAMVIGVVAAVTLAFLAAYRLDTTSFPPPRRQATTYESTARLFVTQPGFPWGRSALRYSHLGTNQPPVVEGDPDRFAQLALLYSQIANTARVQGGLADKDRDAVVAKVVTESQFSSTPIPMVDIVARATTPGHARELASTVTNSLLRFIESNQAQARIPVKERVVLQVIDPPRLGIVASSPSPALPLLVFLTMLFLTIGWIFVVDNWRRAPAMQVVADEEDASEDETLPRIAPAPTGAASGSPATGAVPGRRAAAGDKHSQRRGMATLASRPPEQ
jgi:hypothetical protein